jgi:hypothetical protein
MLEGIELSAIQDENARQQIRRLLNLIEKLSADLRDLQTENQALRDENNHLKGERSKPTSHKLGGRASIRRRKSARKVVCVTKRAKKRKSRLTAKRW